MYIVNAYNGYGKFEQVFKLFIDARDTLRHLNTQGYTGVIQPLKKIKNNEEYGDKQLKELENHYKRLESSNLN